MYKHVSDILYFVSHDADLLVVVLYLILHRRKIGTRDLSLFIFIRVCVFMKIFLYVMHKGSVCACR